MASVNKVLLIGHLGADPEVRQDSNGNAICNLRLATTDSWKDKVRGEKREATEWHRVVLYRKLAEIAADYLRKGSQVYIEGRIKTKKWQDKNGAERFTTEVEAIEMTMLGGRSVTTLEPVSTKPEDYASRSNRNAAQKPSDYSSEGIYDPIPF